MKTLDVLQKLGGAAPESPLAAISDVLLKRVSAREEQRHHEAEARRARLGNGAGPLLSVLQKRLAEYRAERLENNAAPAITSADFHGLLRQASATDPQDRGLGRAATHAYRLWSRDAQGALTVGDVARFRSYYTQQFPRSKVGQVIDTEVPKQGFNVLPVRDLARIAAQVTRSGGDQAAYEEAIRFHGLDKQTAHAFRCRAFVRSLVDMEAESEPAANGDLSHRVRARMASDTDPILSRFGQVIEDDEMLPPEEDLESDLAEVIESPITGEPLRFEVEEAEDEEEEPLDGYSGPLPQGMEVMGQLEDFATTESVFVVEDPTDPEGGELEVTVRPLENAGPQPTPLEPEPEPEPELVDEDLDDMEMSASGGKCGACGVNGHEAAACPAKRAFRVSAGRKTIETFKAQGMSAALARVARHGVEGTVWAVPSRLSREAYIETPAGMWLRVAAEELAGKDEAFQPDINEQMDDSLSVDDDILLGDKTMGKQHHPHAALVEGVLEGRTAKRAGWELGVNGDAEVELRYKGKVKRTASLGDLDELADEFTKRSAPRTLQYAAMKHTASGAYVVVTDVPGKSQDEVTYNARRILSAVRKTVPGTKGLLRKDSKLQLDLQYASDPQLGRVRRILEDQYRVKEAQIQPAPGSPPADVPPVAGATTNEGPIQPVPMDSGQLTQNSNPSPGTVTPPTAAPQQAPQQSSYVGPPKTVQGQWNVTFRTPDGDTAEAPVQARTAAMARTLFMRFNDDCEVVKVAQIVEPGEPLGGSEEAPLPVEEQLMPPPPEADFGSSENLSEEERDALRAALVHYRNQGLGPMGALDQLASQYQDLLNRHGDKTDVSRHEVEAEAMALAAEVWTQPAVLEKEAQAEGRALPLIKGKPETRFTAPGMEKHSITLVYFDNPNRDDLALANRMHRLVKQTAERLGADVHVDGDVNSLVWELQGVDAAMVEQELAGAKDLLKVRKRAQIEAPNVNTQQPDAVSANPHLEDEGDESALEAPTINTQVDPQGNFADTELGKDSETKDPGSFGAAKPKPHPDRETQPGESFADTDLGRDSETDPNVGKAYDQAAQKASDSYRSAQAYDEYDLELNLFDEPGEEHRDVSPPLDPKRAPASVPPDIDPEEEGLSVRERAHEGDDIMGPAHKQSNS